MEVFQRLLRRTGNSHPAIISISLIVLITMMVYWQDFSILANEAVQNEALSHIFLVPILASFMIYRKKEIVKASLSMEMLRGKTKTISLSEITGIAFCLSALLLYWYGSYTFFQLEYHTVSLIIFLMGITLILFNVRTLTALIFPILFLLFLMPLPSIVTLPAGAVLGNFNAQASFTLLKIVGVPVALSSKYGPSTIVINNPPEHLLEFAVDLPCSGIYSLIAFTMFATFLVYIVKGSITKKIVLFPLGFLMLSILNILRISFIVWIAYRFSEETAMTIFHNFSGWFLIFLGMLLLLLITDRLLRLQLFGGISKIASCHGCDGPTKSNEVFCSNCGKFLKNHQTRLSKRFLIKLAALLLTSYLVTLSIQAPVFAFAQGLILTSSNPETSVDVFPQLPDYQLRFLYRNQDFEKISRQDASLLYAYISQNVSNPTVYVLVGVAGSVTNLHSWEMCLVTLQIARGYHPLVTVLNSRDVQLVQNPPITARYFTFHYPDNYTQITLYWYQKALFKTGITIEPKYTRIGLIILARTPNDYPKLEEKLLNMGQLVAAYWKPLRVQSLASLGVPTMQILLGSTTLFIIFLQTTQYTREWRRKITNLKIFEKLASSKEKLLYQTIKKLSQETKETTTQNIVSAFEKATGKKSKQNELITMLDNLKRNGIIKADIVNIQDSTRLVWKL